MERKGYNTPNGEAAKVPNFRTAQRTDKLYAPIYDDINREFRSNKSVPRKVAFDNRVAHVKDVLAEEQALGEVLKLDELQSYESSSIEQGRFGRLYALQDERDRARAEYFRQIDRTHQRRREREEATEANPEVQRFRQQEAFKRRKEYVEEMDRGTGALDEDDEYNEAQVESHYAAMKRMNFYMDFNGPATGNPDLNLLDRRHGDDSFEDLGNF